MSSKTMIISYGFINANDQIIIDQCSAALMLIWNNNLVTCMDQCKGKMWSQGSNRPVDLSVSNSLKEK